MEPEDTNPENSLSLENQVEKAPAQEQVIDPNAPKEITKIAEIQRMNIDQLNNFGKKIGLKHLGSLTKSQMVFEIVKTISERPNELLYGEGVLEILPDGF